MFTWSCHICKEVRPDDKISVITKPLIINGQAAGKQNIRYCNDKPGCIKKVQTFVFFKDIRPRRQSMTLEKAIEILKDILRYVQHNDPPDEHDAIELGIEALKRVQIHRCEKPPISSLPLPGETKL